VGEISPSLDHEVGGTGGSQPEIFFNEVSPDHL